MVADLVEVKVEMAPLIDAALGERAQYIVLSGTRLMRSISDGSLRLRGRVGLLSNALLRAKRYPIDPQLRQEKSVIGHATQFVQVEAPWRELALQLLGTTWLVSTIDDALLLREKYQQQPWRFVTPSAEVLEADGTLFGGPRLSSGGIVARRSELRSLKTQLQRLAEQESLLKQRSQKQKVVRDEAEEHLRRWNQHLQRASEEYATIHAEAEAARRLVQQNQSHLVSLQADLAQLESRNDDLQEKKKKSISELSELEQSLQLLDEAQAQIQLVAENARQEKLLRESQATTTKFDLEKLQQQLESLTVHKLRCQQDNTERASAVQDIRTQIALCRERHQTTSQAVLLATSELAHLYLEQESKRSGSRGTAA